MRVIRSALLVFSLVGAGCAVEAERGEGAEAAAAEASLQEKHLRYAERDISVGPPEYEFWGPTGVSDHGDVYGLGLACDDDFVVCTFDLLKLDVQGDFSLVVADFSPNEINRHGDAGGCVLDEQQFGQAAIAHPNGNVELLPRLPGEISSCIVQLSDNETALVVSVDESFEQTMYVARNNQVYAVPLASADVRDINDRGELAGVLTTADGDRAFHFDSRAQALTLLEPVAGDPNSWGLGIDNKGNVLGYSFVFSGVERIGHWNRNEQFEVAFVEGTPEIPTVSNALIWNEEGLIVVSDDSTDGKTYLIPKPGVRLDLATLLVSGAVPPRLAAYAINERGDFLGQSMINGSLHLFTRVK